MRNTRLVPYVFSSVSNNELHLRRCS